METVNVFKKRTEEYCLIIESFYTSPLDTNIKKLLIILPEIYFLGLSLPEVSPAKDDVFEINLENYKPLLSKKLGKLNAYKTVFNPSEDNEIVEGLLSDDLYDIYVDLKTPLIQFDNGETNDAIWQWKFNIQTHIGLHILDAIKVMHSNNAYD